MKGLWNIFWCVVLWSAALAFTLGFAIVPLVLWLFLTFPRDKARVEAAHEKLKQLLIKGETVLGEAIQTRPMALFKRRELVAITNSRILYLRRGLFGGFRMLDFQWKDMADTTLVENGLPTINGAKLTFRLTNRRAIYVDGLDAKAATKLYSHCQAQEQVWAQKRHVHAVDEARGTFGSGYFGGQQEVAEIADKLKTIKELLDTGAINDVEYEELKAKVIARG